MRPGRHLLIATALTLAPVAVPAHAATIQIVMENLVVLPAEASAKVGDTVEWINKDVFVHTATARKRRGLPRDHAGKEDRHVGLEEGRRGRILLPLPPQHEGGPQRCAVTHCPIGAEQREGVAHCNSMADHAATWWRKSPPRARKWRPFQSENP